MKYQHATRTLPALVVCLAGCGSPVFHFHTIKVAALKQAQRQVAALQKKYPEEKAVNLYREQTYEHFEEINTGYWTARENFVRRYVVFDPLEEPLTTFRLTVAKNWELSNAEIVILSPAGHVQRFGKDELIAEKHFGGGMRYKLAYPKIVKGTVIEERVEVLCPNPGETGGVFYNSIALRFLYPTLKAVAAFSYPKKWSVMIKNVAPYYNSHLTIYESGENRVVRTERANIPPQSDEPYAPYNHEDGDYLRFHFNLVRTAMLVLYGTGTWQQRAKNHQQYVVNNDAIFSRRVSEQAAQITRGAKSELEKFKAIVEYLQREIRTDEEYAVKDFADVLKTKRGGPWQIVGLAHQMAKQVGLDVRYLLIHSARDGYFDKEFTNPFEPGEPALLVTIDGEKHYGFPTVKWLPIDMFLKRLQGRPALRIGPGGFDGFMTLPVHPPADRKVESKVLVKIGGAGDLDVEERVTYYGLKAYDERNHLADRKQDALQKRLKDDLLEIQGDVVVESVKVVDLKERDKPLQKVYRYRINNALTLGQGEAILQSAGIFASSVRQQKPPARKVRVRPIVSYVDSMYQREITIELPPGWAVSKDPAAFAFQNSCGEVSIRFDSSTAGLFKVTKRWKENRFRLPPQKEEVLKQYLDARGKAIVPTLVFKMP